MPAAIGTDGSFDGCDDPVRSLMAFLALSAWYCTIGKEVNSIIDAFSTISRVPIGDRTQIVTRIGGNFELLQLSRKRTIGYGLVCLVRAAVAAVMTYQGTLFLAYEINIGDLLLNAGQAPRRSDR